MPGPRRVTIRDVAAAAGVSHQTVSRVLNDRPDVAEDTRNRVWEIIEELSYQPSAPVFRLGMGAALTPTGEYWQLSRDRPESPTVLAGVAPDDVTRVVVNGTDAAMVEHAWLVVSDVAVDSYTLVRSDGTSQTIDLNTTGPTMNTVAGSTTPTPSG